MDSAVLDNPDLDKNKYRPRKEMDESKILTAIHGKGLHKSERRRRTSRNTIEILDLLSKGYMPYEARRKLNLDNAEYKAINSRICRLTERYQARKIEELVFLAEIRHNHIYKLALQEFEASKKDAKGNARPGNPIYLQVANESLRDIRKLLGLDKSTDFINNGNVAVLNWDSLHGATGQPEVKAIEGTLQPVDPIEERIRELEKIAQEREHLLRETIANEEKEVESSDRVIQLSAQSSISFQETEDEETIEQPSTQPVKKVKLPEVPKKLRLKLKQKVEVVSNINDLCAV